VDLLVAEEVISVDSRRVTDEVEETRGGEAVQGKK
jgi:hypothetical protein